MSASAIWHKFRSIPGNSAVYRVRSGLLAELRNRFAVTFYTGDTRYLQVPMKLNEFFNSELASLPRGGFDDAKET
ncbi:MAG TPA: hypothetical protein VGR96_11735, partial [Acidobacteriaceae bacterium]|nr:hypothetical protein [Acidobacteriaceae bacterium]